MCRAWSGVVRRMAVRRLLGTAVGAILAACLTTLIAVPTSYAEPAPTTARKHDVDAALSARAQDLEASSAAVRRAGALLSQAESRLPAARQAAAAAQGALIAAQ